MISMQDPLEIINDCLLFVIITVKIEEFFVPMNKLCNTLFKKILPPRIEMSLFWLWMPS